MGRRRFSDREGAEPGEDPESDQQRAEKLIHDFDKASANFVSDFFDADWNDPHNYDLVLNTSKIKPDDCIALIENIVKSL